MIKKKYIYTILRQIFRYIEMYQDCQRSFEKNLTTPKDKWKGLCSKSPLTYTSALIYYQSVLLRPNREKNQTLEEFTCLICICTCIPVSIFFCNKYLSSFNCKVLAYSTWQIRVLIVPGVLISRGVTFGEASIWCK